MHAKQSYVKFEEKRLSAPPSEEPALPVPSSEASGEGSSETYIEARQESDRRLDLRGSRETSADHKKFCHQLSRNSSGGRTFAEPIPLSSTDRIDFRLPATALTICFVLLASRTRRRRETRGTQGEIQGVRGPQRREVLALCKLFFFPHFHSHLYNLWITRFAVRSCPCTCACPASTAGSRPSSGRSGSGSSSGSACSRSASRARPPSSSRSSPRARSSSTSACSAATRSGARTRT
jgi:hypothetical protein